MPTQRQTDEPIVLDDLTSRGHRSQRDVRLFARRQRDNLATLAIGLLEAAMPLSKAVRLLGVSLSSLQSDIEETPQLDLPI
jgi:hypothetical protein